MTQEEALDSAISFLIIDSSGRLSPLEIHTAIVKAVIHQKKLQSTAFAAGTEGSSYDKSLIGTILRSQTPEYSLVNFAGLQRELGKLNPEVGEVERVYEVCVERLISDYNGLLMNASDGDVNDGLMVWLREEGKRRGYAVSDTEIRVN